MVLSIITVIGSLAVLLWSADKFVDGAAATARKLGIPVLLIGMVVVGFGTSAPEIVVSIFAANQGNPGLALGNAIGSNIANIALILGITAMLASITISSSTVRRELPLLMAVTLLASILIWDGEITRLDSVILLVVFFCVMGWSIYKGMKGQGDALEEDVEQELETSPMSLKSALLWLVAGMALLIVSSRLLVWGAVDIATTLGVSDVIIGLTIVAIGTSLPELASSIAAVRKNEHDLAIGNVVGSNLFNTLVVIGLAGVISPMGVGVDVLYRDLPVMVGLTVLLMLFCLRLNNRTGIGSLKGRVFFASWIGYTGWVSWTALAHL